MALSTNSYSQLFRVGFQKDLRSSLVSAGTCNVYTGNDKVIGYAYGTDPTVTSNSPITNVYTAGSVTTTDDTLTVNAEEISSTMILDYEESMTDASIVADHSRRQAFLIKSKIDIAVFAEQKVRANGALAYTEAVANVPKLFADISAQFAGFDVDILVGGGVYAVIDNTHLSVIQQAMGANGFSMADAALKNGFMDSYQGVDIFVTRFGQLPTDAVTLRSDIICGVKKSTTLALPTGSENGKSRVIEVSGKLGHELTTWQYWGVRTWEKNRDKLAVVVVT